MFEDFVDNYGPLGFLGVVVAVFVVVCYLAIKSDHRAMAHKAQVCVEAMAMARTSADSVTVKLRCDLPEPEGRTTVIPMPIFIPPAR